MADLRAFLRENAEVMENVKIVVSERFKGEDGKPVPWEIRPLGEDEVDRLRKACTKRVKSKSRGARDDVVDTDLLGAKLIAESVVYPPLKSAELQESYGVVGAEALAKKMLFFGEYANLTKKVYEISGLDDDFEDDKEEAKN
jgi:hypothetical protein